MIRPGSSDVALRALASAVMRDADPAVRVSRISRLKGGSKSRTFRIWVDRFTNSFVLRLYDAGPMACRKEVDLLSTLSKSLPVPHVRFASMAVGGNVRPWAVFDYIDGLTFRQLERRGDVHEVGRAAGVVGEVLGAIGRHPVSEVGCSLKPLDLPLESLDRVGKSQLFNSRLGADLIEAIRRLLSRSQYDLAAITGKST